jgi:Sec-independent protein translocase protein TatA
VGFGSDILFIAALGFLLLGPKRLPAILGQISRAKAHLKDTTHALTSQLDAALETNGRQQHNNSYTETGGEQ